MANSELYAEKANRDRRAKELRVQGFSVRRSSTGPQQIHPMYLEDRKQGLTAEDRGFGNTIYKTYFPNLYEVTWA